jgi:hypothetical protein
MTDDAPMTREFWAAGLFAMQFGKPFPSIYTALSTAFGGGPYEDLVDEIESVIASDDGWIAVSISVDTHCASEVPVIRESGELLRRARDEARARIELRQQD